MPWPACLRLWQWSIQMPNTTVCVRDRGHTDLRAMPNFGVTTKD